MERALQISGVLRMDIGARVPTMERNSKTNDFSHLVRSCQYGARDENDFKWRPVRRPDLDSLWPSSRDPVSDSFLVHLGGGFGADLGAENLERLQYAGK